MHHILVHSSAASTRWLVRYIRISPVLIYLANSGNLLNYLLYILVILQRTCILES